MAINYGVTGVFSFLNAVFLWSIFYHSFPVNNIFHGLKVQNLYFFIYLVYENLFFSSSNGVADISNWDLYYLPKEENYLLISEALLLKRNAYSTWWKLSGFYSRPAFDQLAFAPALRRSVTYNLYVSPMPQWKLHNITKGLAYSDQDKFAILLNIYDYRFRDQSLFSFAVLVDNMFTLKNLLLSFYSEPFFQFRDISELRRRRRHRAKLLKTILLTKLLELNFLFFWLLSVGVWIWLIFTFSGIARLMKVNSYLFFNPEKLWLKHIKNFSERDVWFSLLCLFFDEEKELLRFHKLLHQPLLLYSIYKNFWEFWLNFKIKHTFFLTISTKVKNVRSWDLNFFSVSSFWEKILFSRRVLFSNKFSDDNLHTIALQYYAHGDLLPKEFFELFYNWLVIFPLTELLFLKESILNLHKRTDMVSFLREYWKINTNNDDSVFLLSYPLTFMHSFLSYYHVIFPQYYRYFGSHHYLSSFKSFLSLKFSFSIKSFFSNLIANSYREEEGLFEVENSLVFEDFIIFLEFNNLLEQKKFFSTYFHDYIIFNGLDFFDCQVQALTLFSSYTILNVPGGFEEEDEEENEEEELELSSEEFPHYYWVHGMEYFPTSEARAHFPSLALSLQESVFSDVYYLQWMEEEWLEKTLADGDWEEDLPGHIRYFQLDWLLVDKVYAEDGWALLQPFYNYEKNFWSSYNSYMEWLEAELQVVGAWWLFHNDYLEYELFPVYSSLGYSYIDYEEYSEIFPELIYWFIIFYIFIFYVWIWFSYYYLAPYYFFLWSRFFLTLFFYYFFPSFITFELGLYSDSGWILILYDQEKNFGLHAFSDYQLYNSWFYIFTSFARSKAYWVKPFEHLFKSLFTVMYYFLVHFSFFSALKFLILLLIYLIFSREQFVINHFRGFSEWVLKKPSFFLNYQYKLKNILWFYK